MLNLHFHILWADGVFECAPLQRGVPADFHPADAPTDDEVARLARALRSRVLRLARRMGKLPSDEAADDQGEEQPLLATLAAAAVQGRTALGPRAGAYAPRLGQGSRDSGPIQRGKLCADCEGFSLHAGVRISELCRERLEKLCRYAARPPVVHEHLSLSAAGRMVLYKRKRRFRDGSTHVVLDPLSLIERLAALVPRPRVHLTTYHGIFAPAASCRDRAVPAPPQQIPCAHGRADGSPEPSPAPAAPPRRRRRYSWAELLRRVFLIDVLVCQHCGGPRRLLACLSEPVVIRKILEHLGLPADPPRIAPARPPPQAALPFA